MLQDQGSFWLRIIRAIHGVHCDNMDRCPSLKKGSIWGKIVKSWSEGASNGVDFNRIFVKLIGDGRSTSFWNETWAPLNLPLRISFPRLFALEIEKDARVAERWNWIDGSWNDSWNWRIDPRGRAEAEVRQLTLTLNPISLKQNAADSWSCSINGDGSFSVNSMYNEFLKKKRRQINNSSLHIWNAWIPGKVNVCVWRALQDRLPTKVNLFKRRVDLPDTLCPLCGKENETIEHTMFECEKIESCWRKTLAWWKFRYDRGKKWDLLLGNSIGLVGSKQERRAFHGVCCVTLWSFWKWRNSIVFASEEELNKISSIDIFPSIQSLSFLWLKHRSNLGGSWGWNDWILNPRDLF